MKIFYSLLKKILIICAICFAYLLKPETCYSQLPLITDNTGVQGKRNGQIELSNGLGFHNEHRCIENSSEILPVFTYGINDKCDLVFGYPFIFSAFTDDSIETKIAGFSDLSIELKYQFYKSEYFSLAVKPGVSLPTGKYDDGLGSGKFSETFFFITTAEYPSIIINGNLGYLRNQNRCGDALNIWHASIDADKKLSDEFHFVLNTGIEKNPDPASSTIPAFGLIGLYYFLNDNCEVSIGYEHDFIKEEIHHSFIYGITLRF